MSDAPAPDRNAPADGRDSDEDSLIGSIAIAILVIPIAALPVWGLYHLFGDDESYLQAVVFVTFLALVNGIVALVKRHRRRQPPG